MDLSELDKLLSAYQAGKLDKAEAAKRINDLHYEDIGYARVDHSRSSRQQLTCRQNRHDGSSMLGISTTSASTSRSPTCGRKRLSISSSSIRLALFSLRSMPIRLTQVRRTFQPTGTVNQARSPDPGARTRTGSSFYSAHSKRCLPPETPAWCFATNRNTAR